MPALVYEQADVDAPLSEPPSNTRSDIHTVSQPLRRAVANTARLRTQPRGRAAQQRASGPGQRQSSPDIAASFLSGLPLWNTGLSSLDLWRHFIPSLACSSMVSGAYFIFDLENLAGYISGSWLRTIDVVASHLNGDRGIQECTV
ncbi:uncharacterized protein LAESUDRAFT_758567 [Laetiporus sulphureus 93-53]|uniref:Uncharacterized protein n=1 Tax=Laetiporus sulphureus 93-53 TaxID=1314785 RepID=A0A165EQU3_9APHY|nr:uncharacterized protein LAESUDRAFT_758567 [Laetiporus sulphureus 93-53]KZT07568.1 hypothetical protein LAESUDRAFT_758567 [Laetiporus sulphureus 93-53]